MEHLSIDSRTMKGNDLFVPLIGEKVDAHRFIEQAFGAGAVAVLTSEHDHVEDADHAWIRVADTKKALQEIGRYYRSHLSLPLIGITGSVGKTTTREMQHFLRVTGFTRPRVTPTARSVCRSRCPRSPLRMRSVS